MAFDISKLARMGEFSLELKSLGNVRCLSLNTDHLTQANKKLRASGGQSIDLVRWLFGEMSRRPADGGSDDADKTEAPRLTMEELSSVTDAEVEEFADKLTQKNRYILKTHKGRDIERSVDESACDFLARAFRHHAAEQKAQWDRMNEQMSKSLSGSVALGAMQRDLVQQSALGAIAEANKYLTESSASVASAMHFKREQDLMRAVTGQLPDAQHHLGGVSASVILAKAICHDEDMVKEAALGLSLKDAEANRFWTENSASVASAMHFKHEQDLIRAATGQFPDAQHNLGGIFPSATLAKAIYHNEDMVREAALGLTLRGSMAAVAAAGLKTQQQETLALLKKHEAMFWLPQASETAHLLASYQVGAVAGFAQHYAKDTLDRQHFLEAITTPWVNNVEEERSITALLELQGMGNALRTTKGFDSELTAALRLDLGDWRDKITFPESVIIDPVSRTDFYVARGFNTALTDFPEAAFYQGLHVAGLDGEALDFELFEDIDRLPTESEEAGLRRTNKCHDRLQRFERQLRQFINDAMTAQYGSDWPRKQLDPTLYEQWVYKKQKAENNGVILTLIDVADFTDYEKIICRKNHWREVFEIRFKKIESVRESLQRLYPIRLATMHARIVTKEDKLYLNAEVKRLRSAIK